MLRWEYQTLRAGTDYYTGALSIFSVNGEHVGKLIKKGSDIWGEDEYEHPDLQSYLTDAGKEGWDVAGLSPIERGSETSMGIQFVVILKRPL